MKRNFNTVLSPKEGAGTIEIRTITNTSWMEESQGKVSELQVHCR